MFLLCQTRVTDARRSKIAQFLIKTNTNLFDAIYVFVVLDGASGQKLIIRECVI